MDDFHSIVCLDGSHDNHTFFGSYMAVGVM